ncbi:hypothetical protein ACVWWQ_000121 [Rhodanobacter sp. TND4EL1]
MSSQTFTLALSQFVEKAKAAPAQVVRRATQELLTNIVMRTPVGNPELWEVNRVAVNYNTQVTEHNAALRANPANLTRAGQLRPGKKLHDGMDIVAPAGYVGGRLRANWNVSLAAPDTSTTDAVDKTGTATIGVGADVLANADGKQDIYITNNLPYAVSIEYGHSKKQAPAGMVRVSIAEFSQYIDKAIAEQDK